MHGLILAGGLGTRLAADGIASSKATVPVGGVPQLFRLVQLLVDLECETVVCAVRSGVELPPLPIRSPRRSSVEVHRCSTPSPVHTLQFGLDALPPGPVFCTMVDTVMSDQDWRTVHRSAIALVDAGADLVVAATPYVDDERPLYLELDPGSRVLGFRDQPVEPVVVTGGVYALADGARALVPALIAAGADRMRSYLRSVLSHRPPVRAVVVPRIIDLDRARDLEAANLLLTGPIGAVP
jgi:NDP-sugar pyrophosphorylase family protein